MDDKELDRLAHFLYEGHLPVLEYPNMLAVIEQAREGRKDTKRLEWREAHPKHGFGLYSDGEWADGKGGSHKTYRAAIDAAMQEAERP